MIRVQRGTSPASLARHASAWTDELCREWTRYYQEMDRNPDAVLTTPRAIKSRYSSASVKAALRRMFGKKCCFCEAMVDHVSYRQVEHFRPQSLYPALAYEWSNLLYACERCNIGKSDQFPLAPSEAQPAVNRQAPCELGDTDEALLIDPCRNDPAEHFEYKFVERPEEDFVDVVLTCKTRRGELSREVYDLDRTDLADDRRKHIQDLQRIVYTYRLAEILGDERQLRRDKTELRKAMLPTSEYSAMTK